MTALVNTAAGWTGGEWTVDPIDVASAHILGPSNGFCADIIATVHSTDLPEGSACARLIAAAPDLYRDLADAVARLLVAAHAAGTDDDFAAEMVAPFVATLAKARGEAA